MQRPSLSWLIGLAVQLVEDLLQDGLDFRDVRPVVVFGDIGVRHLVDLVLQPLDVPGQAVDHVDGQKPSHRHDKIKELLVVHLLLSMMAPQKVLRWSGQPQSACTPLGRVWCPNSP